MFMGRRGLTGRIDSGLDFAKAMGLMGCAIWELGSA